VIRVFIGALANIGFILLAAPLLDGLERKIKAWLQNRRGPPIPQTLYDIVKLLRKPGGLTGNPSLLYRIAPYMFFTNMVIAFLFIPTLLDYSLSFIGDIIVVYYLITASSIILAMGSISTGNPFAITGSTREISLSMAGKLLTGITLAIFVAVNKSFLITSLFPIIPPYRLSSILGLVVFAILVYIEGFRLPFDIPEAEPEIAGGVMIEYTGRDLGFAIYSLLLKRLLYTSILLNLVIPRYTVFSPIYYIVGVIVFSILFSTIECFSGRHRIEYALSFMKKLSLATGVVLVLAVLGY